MSYITLTDNEKRSLLNKNGKEAYKFKGHSFASLKGVGKQYCRCCGLVALRTPITKWCIDKGCNYNDSPHYKAALKRLTRV